MIFFRKKPVSEGKYLIVKGNSGFGNRIALVIKAMLYSEITGRNLIIDWTDGMYAEKGINSFFLAFDMDGAVSFNKNSNYGKDIFPRIWIKKLDKDVHEIMNEYYPHEYPMIDKTGIDPFKLDYKEKVVVMTGFGISGVEFEFYKKNSDGKILDRNIYEYMARILKSKISLKLFLKKEIDDFIKNNFIGQTIGVHIRNTDCAAIMKEDGGKMVNDKTFTSVDMMVKKYPDAKIFIATDSLDVLNTYIDIFEDKVVYLPKYFNDDSKKPIHFFNDDKEKSFYEAIKDLYLLANADYLIYSHLTSFGRIARLLSKTSKDKIIKIV